MLAAILDGFTFAQAWLFEQAVQPVIYAAGLSMYADAAFDATEWFLIGVIEVSLLWLVLGTIERHWPVETQVDRRGRRTDMLYTLLHRLGGTGLLVFFTLTPVFDALEGWLRLHGLSRFNLDDLMPGITDIALVSFLIYLLVFDFVDYVFHRLTHAWRPLWALHALHHSQQHMTFWSDDRNHLLEDGLRDALIATVALVIGVAPAQFVGLVVLTRVLESLQHANVRLRFGLLEGLLVSPSFHRRHHAVGFGHEGRRHGCNFAVLFPVWDILFGTCDMRPGFVPTGIRDQQVGRDYGQGFWQQQWFGLRRLFGAD